MKIISNREYQILTELCKSYEEANEYLKKENEKICNKLNQYKKLVEKLKDMIDKEKGNFELLGIENDKDDNFVIVWRNRNKAFDVYVTSPLLDSETKLLATLKEESHVFIEDIQPSKSINLGHGSIAMKYFLEKCRKEKIQIITGRISDVDFDHIDRLKHFYEKHNFVVKINIADKWGSIYLKLDT